MAAAPTDGASSIQVTVRVRPFTIREAAQLTKTDDGPLFLGDGSLAAVPTAPKLGQKGIRSVIKVVDDKCLVFDPPEDNPVQRFSRSFAPSHGKRVKDQTFAFDRVFDENTTQADVYEATTKNLLDSVLDGYNATVFAYGATGCGKTHTITGTAQQPGIIFLTMQELFEKVDELRGPDHDKECEITLSYLEIYNETIRDLLTPCAAGAGKQGLMLREDAHQAVSVAGLSSHRPQNVQEVMDMVIRGNAARTQSPTEANATSSRSHAVLQVNIRLRDRSASVTEPVTMATLSIIDLAGSERASATKNRGERLLEGANINKSLLALGSCINALCDPRPNSARTNHVPYRNSKLTRLLKFSLGGNCRTVMIVCVSPSSAHFDETQNTLRYANRAKNIQTKSVRNVYNVDRHVKDYLKKIDEQRARIEELVAQQRNAEEVVLARMRKREGKRAEVLQEGLRRIRAAYEHAEVERRGKGDCVRRLRAVERRIGALSAWIGGFDQVCEARAEQDESEEAPPGLVAMRKTAQGILIELEGSRQHLHQRLAKDNWARALETALGDGLRQLRNLDEAEPDQDSGRPEETALKMEVESLRQRAEIELHAAVLEQEKSGGEAAGLIQGLLTAHFETIAILGQILTMSEEDAVQAAKEVLGKVLQSCTEATGQVIKPDGSLQITEAMPPSKRGTPRKRRPLTGPSPVKSQSRPSNVFGSAVPSHIAQEMQQAASPQMAGTSSPIPGSGRPMASPRRRVKLGGARRGVAFGGSGTPRKKSPTKKRAVRWRDDAEDGAPLVEFQAPPQHHLPESSPAAVQPLAETREDGSGTLDLPSAPTLRAGIVEEGSDEQDSSPLPVAPVPHSSELRKAAGTGRFAAGFLAKKNDGSPASVPPPPSLTLGSFSSSEDETSPLREMAANSAPHHQHRRSSSLRHAQTTSGSPEPGTKENASAEDAATSSNSWSSGSETEKEREKAFPRDKETANQIRSAMRLKRTSSIGGSGAGNKRESSFNQSHRRRSPTATSYSPPSSTTGATGGGGGGEGIFSASHARRMVKSEREEALRSVLSPRSAPVTKTGGPVPVHGHGFRRSMIESSSSTSAGAGAGLGTPAQGAGAARTHVRTSSVVPGSASRTSAVGTKAAWR